LDTEADASPSALRGPFAVAALGIFVMLVGGWVWAIFTFLGGLNTGGRRISRHVNDFRSQQLKSPCKQKSEDVDV
jgi:hypothetical protein